jgi:hypothetical protein
MAEQEAITRCARTNKKYELTEKERKIRRYQRRKRT